MHSGPAALSVGNGLNAAPPLHAYVTLHPMSVGFCLCMCAYVACAQTHTRICEDTRVRSEHTCISHGVFTKRLCCDAIHTHRHYYLFYSDCRSEPGQIDAECVLYLPPHVLCHSTESISTRHLRAPTRIVPSRRVGC